LHDTNLQFQDYERWLSIPVIGVSAVIISIVFAPTICCFAATESFGEPSSGMVDAYRTKLLYDVLVGQI